MTLDHLARSMQRALDSNRIGTPVGVRLIAFTTPDPDQLEPLMGQLLRLAAKWLNSPIERVVTGGSLQGGEITLLVRCAGGQTGLLSVGVCSMPPYVLEAILFGSRGTVTWDAGRHVAAWTPRSALDEGEGVGGSGAGAAVNIGWRATRQVSALPLDHLRAPAGSLAPPQPPPYGVLLIAGDHTHQPGYAAAFAADDRCRLVGIADQPDVGPDRRQLNERLARRLEIPYFDDLDAAFAQPEVHVVSVCAEPFRRGEIIVRAAQAGKHLYLDKPLCGGIDDAARIVAAVREAGVVAHMFSQVRWEAAIRTRELLDSGRLGSLVSIHADMCFAKGHGGTADLRVARREHPRPQRFERPDAKRELTNVGVYHLVLLLWLLKRSVRTVSATTGNYFFAEHQQRDMEDFGQILLEFEGGTVASVTAGRTGWQSHAHGGINRVCLLGTRGSAVVDANEPRVEVWADAPPWTPPQRDPEDPMGMWEAPADSPFRPAPKTSWLTPSDPSWQTDVGYFLDCVQQARASEVSVEIAAAASEILLAAYQSAAAHETIVLDRRLP